MKRGKKKREEGKNDVMSVGPVMSACKSVHSLPIAAKSGNSRNSQHKSSSRTGRSLGSGDFIHTYIHTHPHTDLR